MKHVSDSVVRFFEDYERGIKESDPELLGAIYNDPFLFASPNGVQVIKKEDFLKVLPKRQGFFKTLGLTSSRIQSLEETRLDNNHIMVKAYWHMQYEKGPEQPIVDETSATYILCVHDDLLRIVFQLDHQDLMKRAQYLGLLPTIG
jgi:hypothetical protein